MVPAVAPAVVPAVTPAVARNGPLCPKAPKLTIGEVPQRCLASCDNADLSTFLAPSATQMPPALEIRQEHNGTDCISLIVDMTD